MKVQFVFAPPLRASKLDEHWEGAMPPLGILYLAAFLRSRIGSIELRATDGLLKGMDGTLAEIRSFRPDILCVSFYTGVALGAYELISKARKDLAHLKVIVGGPHASALPHEPLTGSSTDIVVRGEGEETLYELVRLVMDSGRLDRSDLRKIQGIAFMDYGGTFVQTSPRRPIPDLDTIPFPAWDLLPVRDYRGYFLYKRAPEYPVLFSRGCPFDCTFCSNQQWRLSKPFVRVRSPKNVVDEMEELQKRFGIKEICNVADELNNDIKTGVEICKEIRRRGLDITWKTQLRADRLPEELAKAMTEAGCWEVNLGIESGNQSTLDGIRKHITVAQVESACALLRKYNIKVLGLFMLFNVWERDGKLEVESVEMCENTIRFARKLISQDLIDYVVWSVTTPYPGSELYDIARRHDLIKKDLMGRWDAWLVDDPFVMRLPSISERDQARLSGAGNLLSVKCLLKAGGFGRRDLGLAIKKGTRLAQARLGSMFLRDK